MKIKWNGHAGFTITSGDGVEGLSGLCRGFPWEIVDKRKVCS